MTLHPCFQPASPSPLPYMKTGVQLSKWLEASHITIDCYVCHLTSQENSCTLKISPSPDLGELESSWRDENKNPSAPPTTVMTLPPPSGTASQVVSVWASPVCTVRNCNCSCTTLARLSLPAGAQLHHHQNHHLPDSHKLACTFYKAVLSQNGKQSTDPRGTRHSLLPGMFCDSLLEVRLVLFVLGFFQALDIAHPQKERKKKKKGGFALQFLDCFLPFNC